MTHFLFLQEGAQGCLVYNELSPRRPHIFLLGGTSRSASGRPSWLPHIPTRPHLFELGGHSVLGHQHISQTDRIQTTAIQLVCIRRGCHIVTVPHLGRHHRARLSLGELVATSKTYLKKYCPGIADSKSLRNNGLLQNRHLDSQCTAPLIYIYIFIYVYIYIYFGFNIHIYIHICKYIYMPTSKVCSNPSL